ncbi:acyl-CoA thioester hydrolase [Amaricoccus macauensis]|uniref:Acyl-CoA thioester hydrolase n=1 Tax=Amaricoccus macauensis TaxID=57001 RepID=A0A840SPB3_9RHOB|nr:thioesterase family protein [Amaricoccus macauensis]MBB5221243.1 acyl-CoA thioester hydrolase [Amaricoccus macauensis]
MQRRPPPTRAAFRRFVRYATRWRDNDVYRHMNNAVFYEYADSAVGSWLIGPGGLAVPDGPVVCLVAETACTYHASLGYPDPVDVGLVLDRLGERSMTWRIGLFRGDADAAAGDIRFVHVCVDARTHRPTTLPESLRRAAEEMLA